MIRGGTELIEARRMARSLPAPLVDHSGAEQPARVGGPARRL